jgi:CheY-like chemotaxis protein
MKSQPGYILIVDDSPTIRMKLSFDLESQGHNVTAAGNGREALELMQEQAFDLVLLDILMPEMNGYEVLRFMSQDQILRNIPVIVISAFDEVESLIKCIQMGAEDYLLKSLDPVLLKARIDASLEKKRWRDQEQAYLRQLQSEREKSEALLFNVLPKPIAERLKQGETIIADSFSEVTVLFADIVDFTELSTGMTPADLVVLLNDVFCTFDYLASRHSLEKIKTTGDAYMVVGGLFNRHADHVNAVADMALDMRDAKQPDHQHVFAGL